VVAASGHEWACEMTRVPSEADKAQLVEAVVPSCELVVAVLLKVAAAASVACIVAVVLLD